MDKKRLIQTAKENQENYAYAIMITCSDSRVPVEIIVGYPMECSFGQSGKISR